MTRYKPNNTQWTGSQLSVRDHITNPSERREDLYCLTLVQSEALIAVIEVYRYLTRWLDDDVVTPEEINQFVNDTQRRLMMPCGSDNLIPINRFTENGHYQTSTDGGTTYTDNPSQDPRNGVVLPPPFLPDGTTDDTCTYADSIINKLINDWINATGEGEDNATVVEGILSFLAGILGLFSFVVSAVLVAIAISIVAFGVAAWKAAFVSDVWDRFRCNLKENMQSDGSFTQANVDAIYSRLGDDETGIVLISLRQVVAALGWQGLTFAARQGAGSPTADCDCDSCDLTAYWPTHPELIEYVSGCTWRFHSMDESGHQAIYAWINNATSTFDPNACGKVVSWAASPGSGPDQSYNDCVTGTLHLHANPTGHCFSQLYFTDSVEFYVDIDFEAC